MLHEALTVDADPLHLAEAFNLSDQAADLRSARAAPDVGGQVAGLADLALGPAHLRYKKARWL